MRYVIIKKNIGNPYVRRRYEMAGFIKKIRIHKVRHLTNIDIDITENEMKHLIITGKNGSGKTSLLEQIEAYLEVCLKAILDVQCTFSEMTYTIAENKSGISLLFNNDSYIFGKQTDTEELVLAYFGALRNLKMDIPKSIPKVELKKEYGIQDNLADIFLNYLVYLKTQQSFARNENDMEEVKKIQKWFDRFENALRNLFEDESIYLKFDYRNLSFTINQNGREPYGFEALSDGYSSVLDIVINLILRMESHNRKAYDAEGIVIIDELENHLHIGLQKKILPFLTEFFPNLQFIVSTHSPFVINSIENTVIYDLEKQQRVENLSGIGYEGIVEGYFDINQYSEKIKSQLERYKVLAQIQNKSEEQEEEAFELRRYLRSISPELSPEVVLEFNQLELSRKNNIQVK